MRIAALLGLVVLIAGCGSSAASSPTPIPSDTPIPHKTWPSAPKMTIDKNHDYTATVRTTDGTVVIQLLPKIAPITVNNFVFLARHGYYNHVLFHRIIPGFMIQTGDPTGTGQGSPGYTIKDEKVRSRYTPGTVAMANTGRPNTSGSQFFITVAKPYAQLTATYTIFGRVIRGMSVVDAINNTPVGQDPASQEVSYPLRDIFMETVTVH